MWRSYWDNKTKTVSGINGSGRSPALLTLDYLQQLGITKDTPWNPLSPLCVTVPGYKTLLLIISYELTVSPRAAAGWVDTVDRFGSHRLSMADILAPAIRLARNGFPVGTVCSHEWKKSGLVLISSGLLI